MIKFTLRHVPNENINPILFHGNILSDKTHIIARTYFSSFEFYDDTPDVNDLQIIQNYVNFSEETKLQWVTFSPFSCRVTYYKHSRSFISGFTQNKQLGYFCYNFKFSGNLECDFRTFYSIFCAYDTQLFYLSCRHENFI